MKLQTGSWAALGSAPASGDIRNGWLAAILITAAIMSGYLFISTRSTLWDRDEPRYARTAVEMVESGNYLVPTFNERVWADKPVLLYWLMSVPIRVLGPTELACRFFGAVGSAISCLLTFFIGKRLLSVRAGLWGMVILATTLMMSGIGTAATPDAVMLPFVVGAMAVFVEMTVTGVRKYHIILMGLALGLGMLAKGPIGLLPVPAIAFTLWLKRRTGEDVRGYFWPVMAALMSGVLIFAAWAIPVNSATGGEFMRTFIGRHILTRAIKPMEHHGGNFLLYLPYYLPVVIAGFFPWVLHLPGACSVVLGGRAGRKDCRSVLIGWIVPTFIIMTLAVTKLPHYILFIWPGLALAVGGTIAAAQQNKLASGDKKWLRSGVWLFGPVGTGGALGLIAGTWLLPIPGLYLPCVVCGIVLLVMSITAIYEQCINRPWVSAAILPAGMIIFEVPFLFGVLPAVEQVKISPPIAKTVNEMTAKEVPVVTYKYGEPTLNFYIGRPIETLRSEEAVVDWSRQSGPGVLIIPKDILSGIEQRYGNVALDEIASKKGFNYSKGKIVEVLALIRKAKDL